MTYLSMSDKRKAESLSQFLTAVDIDVYEFVKSLDSSVEDSIISEHNMKVSGDEQPVEEVSDIPAESVNQILQDKFSNLTSLFADYMEIADEIYTTEEVDDTLYIREIQMGGNGQKANILSSIISENEPSRLTAEEKLEHLNVALIKYVEIADTVNNNRHNHAQMEVVENFVNGLLPPTAGEPQIQL